MTTLNFGHKQNSEKSFNSKAIMSNLVANIEQVKLDQISIIALTTEDVKNLIALDCTVVDLDSPVENSLRLYTVILKY